MTYVFEWVVGFVSGGRHSVFAVPGATFTIGVYWIWVPVPAARKKTFWQIQVAPSTLDFNSFYTACHDISSVKGAVAQTTANTRINGLTHMAVALGFAMDIKNLEEARILFDVISIWKWVIDTCSHPRKKGDNRQPQDEFPIPHLKSPILDPRKTWKHCVGAAGQRARINLGCQKKKIRGLPFVFPHYTLAFRLRFACFLFSDLIYFICFVRRRKCFAQWFINIVGVASNVPLLFANVIRHSPGYVIILCVFPQREWRRAVNQISLIMVVITYNTAGYTSYSPWCVLLWGYLA